MYKELLLDMFYAAPELWYCLGGLLFVLLIAAVFLFFSYLKTKQQNYFLRRDRERYAETLYASRDGYFAFIYPDDKVNDPREHVTERCSRRLAVILSLSGGTKSSFEDVIKNFYKEDAKKIEKYVELLRKEGIAFEDYFELKNNKRFVRLEGVRINGADGSIYCDMIWFRDVSLTTSKINALTEMSKQAEEKYWIQHDMADNLPLAVWLRDNDLNLVYCNKKYIEWVGCKSKEEVLQKQAEICDTKGENITKKLAEKSFKNHKACSAKSSIVVNGDRIAVKTFENPFYVGQDLSKPYSAGCIIDINELDELQRTQKQHQEAQLMILGKLGTAFAVFNQSMNLDFCNDAFTTLWNLDKNWLISKQNYASFLDETRENRLLPEVPDYKSFKKEELKIFTTLIEPISDLLHLPDGRTLRRTRAPYLLGGVIFAYEDISDRLAITSNYNQLVTVQTEMLNNLNDAVLVFGPSGRLRFFNDAYLALWNADKNFLIAEPSFSELLDSQKDFFEDIENWEILKKDIGNNILNVTAKTLTLKRGKKEKLQINVAHLSDEALMIVYKKI